VRDSKTFRALSAACTHLGCTVRAEAIEQRDPADPDGRRQVQVNQFSCPCHGSRYAADGANLSGPAPRPLPAFRLHLSPDDGQLVVDLADEVAPGATFTLP
jgi:menaquinol-cytochrome c reductase iron-sulfur subunit